MAKKIALALGVNESQGGNVEFADDVHRSITAAVRAQALCRHGIPSQRHGLISAIHYGEPRE